MKAITLWQPYATAIARRWKRAETRPRWAMRLRSMIGEDVAIHASAREVPLSALRGYGHVTVGRARGASGTARYFSSALHDDVHVALPLGCVVAVVRIAAVVPILGPDDQTDHRTHITTSRHAPDRLGLYEPGEHPHVVGRVVHSHFEWDYTDLSDQLPWGDWTPGRVGILLEDVRPLVKPVPCRGYQQLWTLNSVTEAMVNLELSLADARRARDKVGW